LNLGSLAGVILAKGKLADQSELPELSLLLIDKMTEGGGDGAFSFNRFSIMNRA
jgi:hypothetical protein